MKGQNSLVKITVKIWNNYSTVQYSTVQYSFIISAGV